ncbi:MAG: ABC transporter permease [Deltaproteobacteria bacterium]|nr:ABC transporter permease [Deltaproteobacteria bacterium]MBW1993749.1 ABC transporter permease [Deltaproteobacteria bacterium]MBW2151495.1 ABC transporter permease [Deltaproteobacteria bacterium]
MEALDTEQIDAEPVFTERRGYFLRFLLRDPFAFLSVCWLLLLFISAIIGPELLGDAAIKLNLRARNTPPGSLEKGLLTVLGTDSLGRSMVARLIVATRNTLAIALCAAVLSMLLGGVLGLFAGYFGRLPGVIIMRFSDVLQSFPSLLLAVIVLYILEPRVYNLIIVLAITRLPVYIRVARAEVLEIRERLFVDAARVLGSSRTRILLRHIAPVVAPTIMTILTVDFAFVMLAESGLSFLGIGIQPPSITWGLMVAQGRNYLTVAWWLSFFPGLMIMLSTLSANILSNWLRMVSDPVQRWRFEVIRNR